MPQTRPQSRPQAAPQYPQTGGYVPPRLAPPARAQASAPVRPVEAPAPRVVRGARGKDPAPEPRPLAIPTPEELGVSTTSASLDWSVARRQMAELGVVRFQFEQLPAGASRFSCWLTTGASPRLVQADGPTEAEAVRRCLERAREHQSSKR